MKGSKKPTILNVFTFISWNKHTVDYFYHQNCHELKSPTTEFFKCLESISIFIVVKTTSEPFDFHLGTIGRRFYLWLSCCSCLWLMTGLFIQINSSLDSAEKKIVYLEMDEFNQNVIVSSLKTNGHLKVLIWIISDFSIGCSCNFFHNCSVRGQNQKGRAISICHHIIIMVILTHEN